MLHSVPLKRGIQTLTLMQNPITKAGKMKTKTLWGVWKLDSTLSTWCNTIPRGKMLQDFLSFANYMHSFLSTMIWTHSCEIFSVQPLIPSKTKGSRSVRFSSKGKKKMKNDRVGDSTADVWSIFSYLTCTPLVAWVKRTDVLSKASPLSWTFNTPLARGIKNKEKTQDIWKSNCFSPSVLWETSVSLVTLDQVYLELSVH